MSDAQTQKIQIQNTQIQHMTKCQKDQTYGIFKTKDCSRMSKFMFPCTKYTITNTQIQHMTKCQKDPACGIFLKKDCSEVSKMIFTCVKRANTKIQIHKYTNTQIQHMTKCQIDPTCGIFLKRGLFRGIKNDIHMCQTRKYKNPITQIHKYTNTQIRHMAKCQKDPTCGIFLKRGLFKGIKNDTPMCQMRKYINTNTQIHKYSI